MEALIRDMPTPPGLRRSKVPAQSRNRSVLFTTGVRFEQDSDNPDPKQQKWYCMASATCRADSRKALASGGISVEKQSTGNATRHLLVVHGEFYVEKVCLPEILERFCFPLVARLSSQFQSRAIEK